MNPRILNKQLILLSAALCLTGVGVTLGVVRMKGSEQENGKKVLALRADYDTIQNNYTRLVRESAQTQQEIAQLKERLAAVTADRDNLLAQAHKGYADRNQLEECRASLEQSGKDLDVLRREKDEAVELTQDLKKKLIRSTQSLTQSEAAYQQLSSEKEQVLSALEQLREKTGVVEVQKEKEALARQVAALDSQMQGLRADLGRTRKSEEQLRKDLESSRARQDAISARLTDAERKNKALEKRIADSPARFSELARQNRILISQSAAMHYNLGVFYSSQKEYGRALNEFQRAVELRPNDAASYFNIGYIYAEHIVNREQALEYFQKYLQYADKKDKDADWVKKYIVTWQAWDGKEPMH